MLGAERIVIRLAIEGVPVAAIARSIAAPSEDVWPVLREALGRGEIAVLPRADWPPNTPRENRIQTAMACRPEDLEAIRVPLQRVFSIPPQQARLVAALVTRLQVSRETLLKIVVRTENLATLKSVVCQARASLAQHGLAFETVVDFGYAMSRATADQILVMIKAFRTEEGLR